jgi:hypothetical protein
MNRERLADRPTVDGAHGDVAHEAPVDVHALAVKRRAHQAALVQMPLPVEDEERVPAEEWTEDRTSGLAGPERIAVAAEDVLDALRIREHDELPGRAEGLDRIAVTPRLGGLDRRVRSEGVGEALPEAWRPRSGRERRPGALQRNSGGLHVNLLILAAGKRQ